MAKAHLKYLVLISVVGVESPPTHAHLSLLLHLDYVLQIQLAYPHSQNNISRVLIFIIPFLSRCERAKKQ